MDTHHAMFFRLTTLSPLVFACLLTGCATPPAPSTPHRLFTVSFLGTHIGGPGTSETMKLSCVSESRCSLETESSINGKKFTNKIEYPNAVPLTDLGEIKFAYNYAREHRNQKPAIPGHAELLKQLEPMFEQNPVMSMGKCIDLDPKQPKYLVACKLMISPWDRSTVMLFATVMASCSPSFCRYEFFPLFRAEKGSR